MINNSFKVWISLFFLVNLLLLIWSTGYFKFFNIGNNEQNILVIKPDNIFKKSLPPEDKNFPNEKRELWDAFEQNNSKDNNNSYEDISMAEKIKLLKNLKKIKIKM